MKQIIVNLKKNWLLMALACVLSLSAVSVTGCAGRTKTSTVTTQTTSGSAGSGSTTSVTTQQNVVTDAHPRGVIGGIFYTVGQVIVWPFKVIGSLFS